jgi:hypothetical protein
MELSRFSSNQRREAEFTIACRCAMEPGLSARPLVHPVTMTPVEGWYEIVDAENKRILLCDDQMAPLLEKLLNWALSNYPFQHPEDPGIVNEGL